MLKHFQPDGAAPDTTVEVLDWLTNTSGRNFIFFKTDQEWPSHSPDLSLLDFVLWGYLNDRVYKPMPANTDELKRVIRGERSAPSARKHVGM